MVTSNIQVLSQETIDKIAAGGGGAPQLRGEGAGGKRHRRRRHRHYRGDQGRGQHTDPHYGQRLRYSKDQVPLAFLRHSTSKITSAADLAGVTSLGFRGEALLQHRRRGPCGADHKTGGSDAGHQLCDRGRPRGLHGGDRRAGRIYLFCAAALLQHTARRKFLKSNHTEGTYVFELMQHMALSHPEIAFPLHQSGAGEAGHFRSGNLRDVIYQVFGRQIAANVLDVALDSDDFSIRGFIGTSALARGNRSFEHFFIGGRYVKSALLSRSLEDGYHGFLMQHQYPFCALHLKLRPGRYRCQCPSHQTGGAYRGRAGGSGGPLPSCGPQTFPERGHRSGGDLRALRTGTGAKSGYQNPESAGRAGRAESAEKA